MTGWQIIEDDEIKDPLAQGTKKYDVLDPGPSTHIKSDLYDLQHLSEHG